jgi:hypothetical protein
MASFVVTAAVLAAAWAQGGEKPNADDETTATEAKTVAQAEPLKVAVLDFVNLAEHQGRFYEVRAADAVQLALVESGRFAPGPRRAVRREIRRHQLSPPFDAGAVQLIATVLGAGVVVQGSIERCEVQPTERKCEVEVHVQLLAGATGAQLTTLAESAAVTGSADEPRTLEGLVDAGLQAVAAKLVAAMERADLDPPPPPEMSSRAEAENAPEPARTAEGEEPSATRDAQRHPRIITLAELRARKAKEAGGAAKPVGTPGATVAPEVTEEEAQIVRGIILTALPGGSKYLLSLGEHTGAYKGMELSVYRGSDASRPYGTLRVIAVEPRHCTAIPVGGLTGVQRGDRVIGHLRP